MRAAVNIDDKEACLKYALLSIIHNKDIAINRQTPSKYEQWLDDFNFGDVGPSDVCIRSDVSKIEKLNTLKINIHMWEKGQLQVCC